jgi:hypothetical protein
VARPAVRILNVSQVLRDLDRLDAASDDLAAAFGPIAGTIAEKAAGRVHVLTGRMRATITATTKPNSAIVRAGDGLEYAGVLNYARPGDEFLTGPANEDEDEHRNKIADALDSLIRRLGLNR